MYAKYIKRAMDFTLALLALVILSPLLLVLTILGTIAMGGNPFFTQLRPGKIDPRTGREKIFRLVKFRSMSNKKDKNGNLLPDEVRLNLYGRILRSTSLDELPELWNILRGDMSIVGPRPLLVKYLDRYSERQRHRHDVLPGLTGLAQVNGRNSISWNEKFELDLKYVDNITFMGDVKILLDTILKVVKRDGIHSEEAATMEEFMGNENEWEMVSNG